MSNRIKAVCLTLILLLWVAAPVKAASGGAASEAGEILEYEINEAGAGDLIRYMEDVLIPAAGYGAEWNVISMKAMGVEADYEGFNRVLDIYLDSNGGLKATDYERIALAKAVTGHNDSHVSDAVAGYADSNTIMSYIYGLLVADCVNDSRGYGIAASLISMQKSDGGFALTGERSDPDVTAMALQALAPYVPVYDGEIERAIACLSSMQRPSGGYMSCGVENAESSAQVLIALCALNIDYRTDSRFIKNGNTVFDSILKYKCDGGGYSHLAGGAANKLATTQTLLAMACASRYESGEKFIFTSEACLGIPFTPCQKEDEAGTEEVLSETESSQDKVQESNSVQNQEANYKEDEGRGTETAGQNSEQSETYTGTAPETVCDTETETCAENESVTEKEKETETAAKSIIMEHIDKGNGCGMDNSLTGKKIKIIIMSVCLISGISVIVVSAVKKSGKKKIIVTAACTASAVLFVSFLKIESRQEHYTQAEERGDFVTYIEIEGVSGTIINECMINSDEGDSAFDQLKEAVTAEKISMDYTGSEILGTIYIRSIDGLSEFDYGNESGWTYTVNGEYPQVSCSAYEIKSGDRVNWIYQTENPE